VRFARSWLGCCVGFPQAGEAGNEACAAIRGRSAIT